MGPSEVPSDIIHEDTWKAPDSTPKLDRYTETVLHATVGAGPQLQN